MSVWSYPSKMEVIDGWKCRVYYDPEGNPAKVLRYAEANPTPPPPPPHKTGITVKQKDDATAYHREYYRKVRRERDGRTPHKKNLNKSLFNIQPAHV